MKKASCIIFLYLTAVIFNNLNGQVPVKNFVADSFSNTYFATLKKEYGKHKKIPAAFEKPILVALSYYPELKKTHINFRLKARHTLLETRASWAGLFKNQQARDYVITISNNTEPDLSPLLLSRVFFNEQIGVLGHELAHVADFATYSFAQILLHAIKNVSPKYLDKFEYKTDSICIAHGLGYQLLAWSENLRKEMNTTNWRGPDYIHKPQNIERYMNPATILLKIKASAVYTFTHNY